MAFVIFLKTIFGWFVALVLFLAFVTRIPAVRKRVNWMFYIGGIAFSFLFAYWQAYYTIDDGVKSKIYQYHYNVEIGADNQLAVPYFYEYVDVRRQLFPGEISQDAKDLIKLLAQSDNLCYRSYGQTLMGEDVNIRKACHEQALRKREESMRQR